MRSMYAVPVTDGVVVLAFLAGTMESLCSYFTILPSS